MNPACPQKATRRTEYYSAFAFGTVILACFSSFLFTRRVIGEEWQVVLTFLLGGVYTVLGVMGDDITGRLGRHGRLLNLIALSVVTVAMLFVSPVRGFFAIIALPVVSMAIFEFNWKGALLAGFGLFAACVMVYGVYYGPRAIPEAMMSYAAAFVFTIVFSLITRQALHSRDQSEKLRAELEVANEKLRAAAAQTEELATTRERNRLAREIHDGVGHYLTVVKTQLDAAAALLPAQPEQARTGIAKAAKLTAEALDDVRRSVGTLRSDAARPPLPDAIRQLAVLGDPAPTVSVEGALRPLPPAVEHALFRAVQEGLTNIRKHARATSALVVLDFREPRLVRLELSDNGQGSNGEAGAGFGLAGIRERVELLGGRVETGNRLEGGFALRVEVPA